MLHDLVFQCIIDVKGFEVASVLLVYGNDCGRRIDYVAYLRKGFLRSVSGCVQIFEFPVVRMDKLVRIGLIRFMFRYYIALEL